MGASLTTRDLAAGVIKKGGGTVADRAAANGGQKARFKKGDRVKIPFGPSVVTGEVVEDRGEIGVHGRRLYRVKYDIGAGEDWFSEVAEEEITAAG